MAGRRREENLEAKIIIRNYPLDTDDRDLRIMFEKYGKIEDCECDKNLKKCLTALYKDNTFYKLNLFFQLLAILLFFFDTPTSCSVYAKGERHSKAERFHVLSVQEERRCYGCHQGNERTSEYEKPLL